MGESGQANIATVWDFDFWREFLDRLARNRYNFVSLWNLHPFPSMVKVPGYEDIALDDVQRSTIQFAENYSNRVEDILTPEMLAHTETVRKLTIDEKIAFWRRVMEYARDRNIGFHIITWNIYTYGTLGKHGITDAINNPVTADYYRKSVAQLFRTYDPELDNDRLAALIGQRYRRVEAKVLFDAWQHASMTYPLTTGFHWGALDFQWYIEGCLSQPQPAQTASGFHDVNRFITLAPHPGTDNIAIPRYVEAMAKGERLTGTTPVQVAARLHEHATAALADLGRLEAGDDAELRQTLADIRAMAQLGEYYSNKIRGATALALFRRLGRPSDQQQAVAALTSAADSWAQYTVLARAAYKNPLWMNRVGNLDWTELTAEVARDIVIAREAKAAAQGL